ncbi:MAG TPA: hypothetical protein VFZ69_13450 [Longimicrobiales bacterium]
MKRTAWVIILVLAVSPARGAAQVTAERWFDARTLTLTFEVGGAAFSDFERSRAYPTDGTVALTDFGRRISARTSGSLGGWAGYWIGRGLGVRAGVSWTPTRFRVWNDETGQLALDARDPGAVDPMYASLAIWAVHGAALYRFPRSFGRVAPYALLGGGWTWYRAGRDAELPPEARTSFATGRVDRGAALAGLGAAIPLQRGNLLMTFELTDLVTRAPLAENETGEVFELAGVSMQIGPDAGAPSDDDIGFTHHVRLAFGLTLPIR